MNDPWLMNRNLNIYNLANPEDASAVRVRIDGDSAVSLYRYGAVSYASGWMDTPQGRVRSSWLVEPEEVVYDIEMPCEGTLVLPSGSHPLHAGRNSIRQSR